MLFALVLSTLACENSHLTQADLADDAPIPTDTTSSTSSTSSTINVPVTSPTTNTNVHLQPVNYPARVGYINKVTHWWGDNIAKDLGVPGMAPEHDYNYMVLAFWKCQGEPLDIALLWQNAYSYFGAQSILGKTNHDVQRAMRKKYNDAGVKVLVSAFGATEHPTSANQDPTTCAHKLGKWVIDNNVDGADIDWEDNSAMEAGKGEQWLIDFTKALREVIPNHIVIHAPQGPYFKEEFYRNGAYITIDKAVGHLIDFYFVQFYNQGNTRYDTYEELFTHATGVFSATSVKQIANRGVPLEKIIVGKPVVRADAMNTGFVEQETLGTWSARAYDELGWFGGIGHWQYPSDKTGKAIAWSAGPLKLKCQASGNCH